MVNIGIIGAGMIGTEHASRITNELTGGEVVAVNDVNENQARSLVEKLNLDAQVFASAHDLIHSEQVDAVLITSWGPTHEEFVLAAIAAGKYVFCEKPLATTAKGCNNIIDAEIKANKRLVQVGFMRRYDQGYRLLKDLMSAKTYGEPLVVTAAHRNPAVPEAYVTPMAITDTLVHELDTFRWLFNDDYKSAQVVFARKTRHAHDKVQDPQLVLLETQGGIRINVEIFVNCQYGYDIQCSVSCEDGVVSLPDPTSVVTKTEARRSTNILTDWKERFAGAFSLELQAFIDSVSGDRLTDPAPSSWDGMAAAVASDACVEAQETGGIIPIVMPEQSDFY